MPVKTPLTREEKRHDDWLSLRHDLASLVLVTLLAAPFFVVMMLMIRAGVRVVHWLMGIG